MFSLRYGEYGFYAERQFAESFGDDACWNQMGGLGGRVMAEDHAIIQRGTTPVALQCVGLPIGHDPKVLPQNLPHTKPWLYCAAVRHACVFVGTLHSDLSLPPCWAVYAHRPFQLLLIAGQPLGNQLAMLRCGGYATWWAWPMYSDLASFLQ